MEEVGGEVGEEEEKEEEEFILFLCFSIHTCISGILFWRLQASD